MVVSYLQVPNKVKHLLSHTRCISPLHIPAAGGLGDPKVYLDKRALLVDNIQNSTEGYMKKTPALRLWPVLLLISVILVMSGCATVLPGSGPDKLSDAYFNEIRDNEDPFVMDYFYQVNDSLAKSDFVSVVNKATMGIDTIPKYKELFSYFYATRAYGNIMLFKLEAGKEDITNLTWFDKKSSMIPGLWTYYYFSYAPFDSSPKDYYRVAKEWLIKWRAASPLNVFEKIFSDPARITAIEKIIDDELQK
jgi:hypothetical protein